MTTRPVCLRCAKFYTVKRNGVAFEEMRRVQAGVGPFGVPAPPAGVEYWAPYRLWLADLLACPSCGAEILVTAHDQKPIAEHYHSDYDDVRATLKPSVRVEG